MRSEVKEFKVRRVSCVCSAGQDLPGLGDEAKLMSMISLSRGIALSRGIEGCRCILL